MDYPDEIGFTIFHYHRSSATKAETNFSYQFSLGTNSFMLARVAQSIKAASQSLRYVNSPFLVPVSSFRRGQI